MYVMAFWGRPLLRRTPFLSHPLPLSFSYVNPFHLQKPTLKRKSVLYATASLSMEQSTSSNPIQSQTQRTGRNSSWKPMCLYYTQGRCTKVDDAMHLEKFSHSCAVENISGLKNKSRAQQFDYFLVLDLEGKVEILEFPVLLFETRTMSVVDLFHRFVRPTKMSEQRTNEYIEGKYGKFGVDRVWHDTAIEFEKVIEQFEDWLHEHNLWTKQDRHLNKAAFVTCGNWDVKTKIPQQCEVSGMKLPPYFMEWINLKDIYLNFYDRRAPGMLSMMRELEILPLGSHHLGIDDSKNIARVLQRLMTDGVLLQITARRTRASPGSVKFFFQDRI